MPSHTYHKCVYVYINTRKRECCCCCCCCCVFPLAWIHQTKTNLTEGRDQQTGESCCLDAIFFLVSFMYVMWASIKRRHSSSSLSLSLSGTWDEELLNVFLFCTFGSQWPFRRGMRYCRYAHRMSPEGGRKLKLCSSTKLHSFKQAINVNFCLPLSSTNR